MVKLEIFEDGFNVLKVKEYRPENLTEVKIEDSNNEVLKLNEVNYIDKKTAKILLKSDNKVIIKDEVGNIVAKNYF